MLNTQTAKLPTPHSVAVNPYHAVFLQELIAKTSNFSTAKWLGRPILQNILDLWTIQETISEIKPALLIETGTFMGGSALFYAHLFDLLGSGEVISIDLVQHQTPSHPRIEFLAGSSIQIETLTRVRQRVAAANGPVMVILDSNHSADHVYCEMNCYGPMVTPNSYMLVQDGICDLTTTPDGSKPPPGPLSTIHRFLPEHPEFAVDTERCERFLITHHPSGWLKRRR